MEMEPATGEAAAMAATDPTGTSCRILVVDNYDSFVYTIIGYLEQMGAECVVVRNDAVPETSSGAPDHLPRSGQPPHRGAKPRRDR